MGCIFFYSFFQMIMTPQRSLGFKFWTFIWITSFLLLFLLAIFGFFLEKRIKFLENDKKMKEIKNKLTNIDKFIISTIICCTIILVSLISIYIYLSTFISFNKLNGFIIFTIPFPILLQISIYCGLIMIFIVSILIFIFWTKNPKPE